MMESKQIITVVISLMLLVIGIFAVAMVVSVNTTLDLDYEGTFGVGDTTVDQNCDTNEYGMTITSVERWDGVSWNTVSAYTYAGDIVTVPSSEL